MVDFIRFNVPSTYRESFLNNPKYSFIDEFDVDTGQVRGLPKCIFKGMRIEIYNQEIVIYGSIHKFYNLLAEGSAHNYNQFTHSMLSKAIKCLLIEMDIKSEDAVLHNLEFGLNISVAQIPKEFLRNNVLMLKCRRPSLESTFDGKGYFTEYKLDRFYLKVYDKSKQYKLDTPLIRLEIKTRKMKHIEKTGIKFITDLLDKEKLLMLKGMLMNHVSNLVIIDSLDLASITEDGDRYFIQKYTNPQQLNKKTGREKKRTWHTLLKKLEGYGLLNFKKEIMLNMSEAWDKCMNDLTQFENPPKPLKPNADLRKNDDGHNSPIYIG